MTRLITTKTDLRAYVSEMKRHNRSIGFVPTMGALHDGHLALVRAAKTQNDSVIVSIFVNPLQFGENEDFTRYPKTLEADMARLEAEEVDVCYAPDATQLYPEGFDTTIHVAGASEGLCGAHRPGHFDGVATVVAKLFHQVMPDTAWFGEKDYQQLCVIRQMVRDLDMAVDIAAIPTVRETDGLAMSSRNRYLSQQEREIAPRLYETLGQTAKDIRQDREIKVALGTAKSQLIDYGFDKVDYLELRHAETWQPLDCYQAPARLLIAAWLGQTRLIDNIGV